MRGVRVAGTQVIDGWRVLLLAAAEKSELVHALQLTLDIRVDASHGSSQRRRT